MGEGRKEGESVEGEVVVLRSVAVTEKEDRSK